MPYGMLPMLRLAARDVRASGKCRGKAMDVRVDYKGKVFTDHVRKQQVACVIQTISGQRVRGSVFFNPDERMKDNLNAANEQFIAVTDAEILSAEGLVIERTGFLAVNKQHVV